jgi:valyl-tRNA synthetase
MDKVYNHKDVEEKIYKSWEEKGYFKPEVNPKGKPFTIILPPPNANAPLHLGHAMYTVEDILIRYHRMLGDSTLWLPGADHAGFETQFVFEKQLQKEGKSRFDYDRDTLYKMIWDYVQENRPVMEAQLRRLGFSLDWTRKKFTLDPDILPLIYKTFKQMFDDGLIYRGERLVNYCTKDGTSLSDYETNHIEKIDPLYYMKYGPFVLATVRPETKFGDTAIAVHPDDKRYKEYIGKEIEFEGLIGKVKLKVVGDEAVDPKFGTGVVKVTPAHDFTDYEIGKRHALDMKQVIGFDGKLTALAGKYAGLRIKAARELVVKDLGEKGLMDHIDQNYTHTVAICYKCGNTLEPLLLPQWYIKVAPLVSPAIEAVKKQEIKIVPKRFEKVYYEWLENLHDWNISRQVVWGIRIPAWKCEQCNEWIVTQGQTPKKCTHCNSTNLVQDTDSFDTWFSSGQWPFVTLMTNKMGDFERFYPTSVMETGYDILKPWVSKMIMMGIYATGKIPFETVYLHGLIRDGKGQKMSKSKGNVVNPIEMVDKYSADSLRMALIFGSAAGNDIAFSEDKIRGMRNFTNKLWNIGRFIEINKQEKIQDTSLVKPENKTDKKLTEDINKLTKKITQNIDKFELNLAAESLYEFIWHEFADNYIENVKSRITKDSYSVLLASYLTLLKLLHPFMPFITEEIYGKLDPEKEMLIISSWPKNEKIT